MTTRSLASGAGHDAAWIARVAPAAMISCRAGGRSHAADEWTENDAIARGAAVLFEAVFALDARPESARDIKRGPAFCRERRQGTTSRRASG